MINNFLKIAILLFLVGIVSNTSIAQKWNLSSSKSIKLDLSKNSSSSVNDNIEMSGTKVSAIIYYVTDEDCNLKISRDIIFPQLRTYNKSNEPDWKKYRAYFRKTIGDEFAPSIAIGNELIVYSKVDSIEINGKITFHFQAINNLKLTKTIFPSMEERILVEEWKLENIGNSKIHFTLNQNNLSFKEKGYKGTYTFNVNSDCGKQSLYTLESQEALDFSLFYSASIDDENSTFSAVKVRQSRDDLLNMCQSNLVLKTPDDTLNQLFYFSKIRAAESIFNSSMGLVHSPGGGNYYVGIWANDQIEYSGPFFPYLGYEIGKKAAYNAYQKFAENIPTDDSHIPYAFEVDGNFAMGHLDRGDAAMIAYGTSLYLLNSGNIENAKKLWPLIKWSLNYCHNNRNQYGAVESESDEMEGRIKTGTANLSTSSLYYGGLKFSKLIASQLGEDDFASQLGTRKNEMEQVIENYFGAKLEGLETYKYFEENKFLRHWICLPLTMGIESRKEGTIKALFDKMWTEEGILVEYNPDAKEVEPKFWDRATLYALRGALKAGKTEIALPKLKDYSKKRLLGSHVPYPVEAFPENNMKHLSAESALYCRVFIEGLLGLEPSGFSSFYIQPRLPKNWNYIELENIYLFGVEHDISINRQANNLILSIENANGFRQQKIISNGERTEVIISN